MASDGAPVYFDFGFAARRPRIHDLAYALSWLVLRPEDRVSAEDFVGAVAELLSARSGSVSRRRTAVQRVNRESPGRPLPRTSTELPFLRIAEWVLTHPSRQTRSPATDVHKGLAPNPWRSYAAGVQDKLRTHDAILVDGRLRLRPFTEDDWHTAASWQSDLRVLWFSEGDFVEERSMAETQAICRAVSQTADMFVIEHDGVAVGDGWLQAMNLRRITAAFPGLRTSRIDLQLAYDVWGQGLGSRAIRLLTERGFDRGDELVFGLDIADFNERSRRAFLHCRYVPWRRVTSPPGAKTSFVYDLVCRPGFFYGTEVVKDHPGADRVRAGDRPYGATIVVYRRVPEIEVLVLHRTSGGAAHEGDWAWTPPAGARFPAEPINECAARELHEEVGLDLGPRPLPLADEAGWAVYVLDVPADIVIRLDDEHDRYQWLSPGVAIHLCRPAIVADSISRALSQVI